MADSDVVSLSVDCLLLWRDYSIFHRELKMSRIEIQRITGTYKLRGTCEVK